MYLALNNLVLLTTTQLLKVIVMWTESLESGGQIDVIYTDVEETFDKCHIKDKLQIIFI